MGSAQRIGDQHNTVPRVCWGDKIELAVGGVDRGTRVENVEILLEAPALRTPGQRPAVAAEVGIEAPEHAQEPLQVVLVVSYDLQGGRDGAVLRDRSCKLGALRPAHLRVELLPDRVPAVG